MARHTRIRNRALPLVAALAMGLIVAVPGTSSVAQTAPSPSLSKVFSPSTIGPGSTTTLEFTIDNSGNPPATGLTFTDDLPVGVTVASAANAVNGCDGDLLAGDGSTSISLTDGRVAGGSSCTIAVDVTSASVGTHTNTTSDLTFNSGSSGSASADLTVAVDRPGFSKVFETATVPLGARTELTFTVDNTANVAAAAELSFTDALPSGVEVADPANAGSTCGGGVLTAIPGTQTISYQPDFLIVGDASVAAASSCTVSVEVVATAAGVLANSSGELSSVEVLQSGFGPVRSSGKANAPLEVTVSDIHLVKEFTDDPIAPGGVGTLEFRIANRSRSEAASGVAFTDALPAGVNLATPANAGSDCGGTLTAADGGTSIELSGGFILPEGECAITVDVTAALPGNYPNTTGEVTGTIGQAAVSGNAASDDLFVEPAPSLSKTFVYAAGASAVAAGDSVDLEFTITNTSSTAVAADLAFIDDLTGGAGASGPPGLGLPFPVSATLPSDPCGPDSSIDLISLGTKRQGLSLTGGELALNASCTFTVTLAIPSGFPTGAYLNTTQPISGTVGAASLTGNSAVDEMLVVGAPKLRKTFDNDPIAPGDTVDVTYTLSNNNFGILGDEDAPRAATDIGFSDDLTDTDGLSFLSVAPGDLCGGTLIAAPGDTSLAYSGGSLDGALLGETCSFTVTLKSELSTPLGATINTTEPVTATVLGVDVVGDPGEDTLLVADISVTKEFTDDPVFAGAPVTLAFTLTNKNPSAVAGVTFTDDLDDTIKDLAVATLPANPVCGGTLTTLPGGTFLQFVDGEIGAGSPAVPTECSFNVELTVPAGAAPMEYSNITSNVSADVGSQLGVELPPATDRLVVTRPDILKEFVGDPVDPGDPVTLRFTLTNPSTSVLTDLEFTDDLTATLDGLVAVGLPIAACGGTLGDASALTDGTLLELSGGTLAGEADCTFDVTLNVPVTAEPGVYTNTTSVLTGDAGVLVTGPAATDTLTVDAPPDPQLNRANLAITKLGDVDSVVAGGTVVYTISVTNAGPDTATNVVVTDTLPAEPGEDGVEVNLVTPVATSGCLEDPNGLPCSLGDIAVGASAEYTLEVHVLSTTLGTITNVASVTSDIPDPVANNNTAREDTMVLNGADLSITKADDIDPIEAHKSEWLVYTITVTNNGPFLAEDIVVIETLPPGVDFKRTEGCAEDKYGVPTCTLGDLAAGSSVSYVVEVKMRNNSPLGIMTNTAEVTASTLDQNSANDIATEDTLVCDEIYGGECDEELGSPFVLPSAVTPAAAGAAPAAAPASASAAPSSSGPAFQGDTLPATGSDSTSPMTLAALSLLAAGLGFFGLGRTRRRRPAS